MEQTRFGMPGVEQEDLYGPFHPGHAGLWDPAVVTLHSHLQRSWEDRPWTANPWGARGLRACLSQAPTQAMNFHQVSQGFVQEGLKDSKEGAIPTSQGPMPVPHLVQSSKLPFPRARTCCFSLTCFCPVRGSVTAWLHPRDLLGQGTSTPRAPGERAVSNSYS